LLIRTQPINLSYSFHFLAFKSVLVRADEREREKERAIVPGYGTGENAYGDEPRRAARRRYAETRRDVGAKSRPGSAPTPRGASGENTAPAYRGRDVGAAIAPDGGNRLVLRVASVPRRRGREAEWRRVAAGALAAGGRNRGSGASFVRARCFVGRHC